MSLFSKKSEETSVSSVSRGVASGSASKTGVTSVRNATGMPKGQTVISANVTIKGEIHSGDDIVIEGTVEGTVHGQRSVVVGPSGKVRADIEAEVIEIQGHVRGNLTARERAYLGNGARVEGDIRTRRLVVEENAYISGRVEMLLDQEVPQESEPPARVMQPEASTA